MGKIQVVFVWMGGVLAETIPNVTSQLLYGKGIESIDLSIRLQLRDLARDLSLGRIDTRSFCHQAAAGTSRAVSAEELDARIRDEVTVRKDVLEVILELPAALQRWLISDYPSEWHSMIARRSDLYTCFPVKHTIATSALQLSRLVPDVFYTIILQTGFHMEACLMIDGHSARAVEAIRHGLPATIFVDARRLKREFVLREIMPRHFPSIHEERLSIYEGRTTV